MMTKRLSKFAPKRIPSGGMRMSSIREVITPVNPAPTMMPTARPATFPPSTKSWNLESIRKVKHPMKNPPPEGLRLLGDDAAGKQESLFSFDNEMISRWRLRMVVKILHLEIVKD